MGLSALSAKSAPPPAGRGFREGERKRIHKELRWGNIYYDHVHLHINACHAHLSMLGYVPSMSFGQSALEKCRHHSCVTIAIIITVNLTQQRATEGFTDKGTCELAAEQAFRRRSVCTPTSDNSQGRTSVCHQRLVCRTGYRLSASYDPPWQTPLDI